MSNRSSALHVAATAGAVTILLSGCSPKASEVGEAPASPEETAAAGEDGTDAACGPDGPLAYVCGLFNAEDILQVGSSKWLVASSIAARDGSSGSGRLYLIDSRAKTGAELFPGDSPALQPDTAMYGSCDSIDLDAFDTHGLAMREISPGRYRLYATSHGAMEAIQAFELDATGDAPTVVWRGCVPLPADMWANSVTILADGGFIATKFIDPTDPEDTQRMLRGEMNGAAYQWRPGQPVAPIPGTELSGPNGIEQSPDGRYLFVAAFGADRVARFDLGPNPELPAFVSLDIAPDNLRWTERGTLLTVGNNSAPNTGWTVYEIDPDAMTASRVAGVDQSAALQGAATALEVDGEIWVGTFNGDRVGHLRRP